MSSPAATTPSPSVHPRTGPRTRPCSNCGAAIGFAAKSCKQCKTKTRRGLGLAPLEAASTAARRAGADRREAARIEDRLSSLVGKNLYRVSRVSAGALEASSPEHARFDAAVIKGLDQAAARGAVKAARGVGALPGTMFVTIAAPSLIGRQGLVSVVESASAAAASAPSSGDDAAPPIPVDEALGAIVSAVGGDRSDIPGPLVRASAAAPPHPATHNLPSAGARVCGLLSADDVAEVIEAVVRARAASGRLTAPKMPGELARGVATPSLGAPSLSAAGAAAAVAAATSTAQALQAFPAGVLPANIRLPMSSAQLGSLATAQLSALPGAVFGNSAGLPLLPSAHGLQGTAFSMPHVASASAALPNFMATSLSTSAPLSAAAATPAKTGSQTNAVAPIGTSLPTAAPTSLALTAASSIPSLSTGFPAPNSQPALPSGPLSTAACETIADTLWPVIRAACGGNDADAAQVVAAMASRGPGRAKRARDGSGLDSARKRPRQSTGKSSIAESAAAAAAAAAAVTLPTSVPLADARSAPPATSDSAALVHASMAGSLGRQDRKA